MNKDKEIEAYKSGNLTPEELERKRKNNSVLFAPATCH